MMLPSPKDARGRWLRSMQKLIVNIENMSSILCQSVASDLTLHKYNLVSRVVMEVSRWSQVVTFTHIKETIWVTVCHETGSMIILHIYPLIHQLKFQAETRFVQSQLSTDLWLHVNLSTNKVALIKFINYRICRSALHKCNNNLHS